MGVLHRRPRPGDRVQFPHSRRMGYVGIGTRNTILLGSGPGPKGHGVSGITYYWVEGTGWVHVKLKDGKRK